MSEKESRIESLLGLDFIRSATWDEVRRVWKNDEDTDIFRREYVEQGYDSWESWRKIVIEPLHLERLDWTLYDIARPTETVPQFRGGPFKPWQELYYGDKTAPTFSDIVTTEGTDVMTRDKFAAIIATEKPMWLIGLRRENDIYIIEGMHRSTAIALAALRSQMINTSVQMFLAETDLAEFKLIE